MASHSVHVSTKALQLRQTNTEAVLTGKSFAGHDGKRCQATFLRRFEDGHAETIG
jgi:hypothetical protein